MSLKEVVQLQEKELQSLKENQLDIENKISKTKNIDSIRLDLQFQIDSIYSIISGQQRHDHSASYRLLTDKHQHMYIYIFIFISKKTHIVLIYVLSIL